MRQRTVGPGSKIQPVYTDLQGTVDNRVLSVLATRTKSRSADKADRGIDFIIKNPINILFKQEATQSFLHDATNRQTKSIICQPYFAFTIRPYLNQAPKSSLV